MNNNAGTDGKDAAEVLLAMGKKKRERRADPRYISVFRQLLFTNAGQNAKKFFNPIKKGKRDKRQREELPSSRIAGGSDVSDASGGEQDDGDMRSEHQTTGLDQLYAIVQRHPALMHPPPRRGEARTLIGSVGAPLPASVAVVPHQVHVQQPALMPVPAAGATSGGDAVSAMLAVLGQRLGDTAAPASAAPPTGGSHAHVGVPCYGGDVAAAAAFHHRQLNAYVACLYEFNHQLFASLPLHDTLFQLSKLGRLGVRQLSVFEEYVRGERTAALHTAHAHEKADRLAAAALQRASRRHMDTQIAEAEALQEALQSELLGDQRSYHSEAFVAPAPVPAAYAPPAPDFEEEDFFEEPDDPEGFGYDPNAFLFGGSGPFAPPPPQSSTYDATLNVGPTPNE